MRRALAVVPVVAALVIAGCGSSHPSVAANHKRIVRAAYVSSTASGYQVRLSLSETLGSTGQVTATGTGSFAPATNVGSMTMSMSLPGSAGALGPIDVKAVILGTTYYIGLPSQLATLLGGKSWVSFSIADIAKLAGLPGLGSMVSSAQSLGNPGEYLSFMKAVSSTGLKDLGSAKVDGTPTTHYAAQLDFTRLPNVMPANERAAAELFVKALESKTNLTAIPIDVWIDSQNRIRRIVMNYSVAVPTSTGTTTTTTTTGTSTTTAGQTASVSVTEDFTSYGPQATPSAPPSSQTLSIASLLHNGKLP